MQGRIIFLAEERSMGILLEGLLPRIFPGIKNREHFLCITHEGKSDLDLSIPRKLRGWKIPQDRFVVLRDNDNANCVNLKQRITQICERTGRPDVMIRLVCQELESWYLGDLIALSKAFDNPKLDTPKYRKRYIDPDSFEKPSHELSRIIPTFQKGSAARAMASTLTKGTNCSKSYASFISGFEKIAAELGYVFEERI